jgi:drug/metabolite transporter (DMT)-like permease
VALHQASGRWRLGLALALTTAACWATLPVALKITLEQVDVYTLTWFRFAVAALGLGAWLAARGALRGFAGLRAAHWGLLALAAAMLIGNYVFYLLGLHYTTPATAQLLIQLAPLLMALGGVAVFGERFAAAQWLGLALLVGGMWLFFAEQRGAQGAGPDYVLGCAIIVLAAIVWALYALAQKQLLQRLSSALVLWFVYAVASLVLLPLAAPARLAALDGLHWALLLFCALNTLLAYGAFAEALAHWEASRVSAVLAMTPLLTVASVEVTLLCFPGAVAPQHIGLAGFAGAALVVLGSALTSLLGTRRAALVVGASTSIDTDQHG